MKLRHTCQHFQSPSQTTNSLRFADGPRLAAPIERHLWGGPARKRIEPICLVEQLGVGNGFVERLNCRWRAVHDRGARVDDGLEVGKDGGATDDSLGTGSLPETAAGDAVVLNRATVEVGVGSTEVELGAGGGELETEDVGRNGALSEGVLEEGGLERDMEDGCQKKNGNWVTGR